MRSAFSQSRTSLTHRLALFPVLGLALLPGHVAALLLVVAVLLRDALAFLLVLGVALQVVRAFLSQREKYATNSTRHFYVLLFNQYRVVQLNFTPEI